MIMTAMHPSTVPFACALAGLFTSAAFAQATDYTSVEAIAAKPVQLSYHASANKNCMAGPPPMIRVTQPPRDGVLMVRKALLTTDKIAGCPGLKTPVEVVLYQAREGYTGPDHVAYEVTNANGKVGVFDVAITVKGGPAPKPSEQKGTSL
jgi:hypothetical protein